MAIKSLFIKRVDKRWSRLLWGVVELVPLEVFKNCVDVAVWTWFNGEFCSAGSGSDSMILRVFSNLNNYVTLDMG